MMGSSEPEDSYPRMEETRHGLPVDAGIVTLVERAIDVGLTPRASCSGLDRDHAPETDASPYLSIQIAPTFEVARPTTRLPDEHRDAHLRQQLQCVGDRADWVVEDTVSWMLYPGITFRLAPTRGGMKNRLFGRERDFDDLSDEEESRLDYRYDEATAEVDALSDTEITARWEALQRELTNEFEDADVPQFNDRRDAFEAAQENWPEVFETFFDSDDELLKFYER